MPLWVVVDELIVWPSENKNDLNCDWSPSVHRPAGGAGSDGLGSNKFAPRAAAGGGLNHDSPAFVGFAPLRGWLPDNSETETIGQDGHRR